MKLDELIPDNSSNWIIKNDTLMYYKYNCIPICYIGEDSIVYIYLDNKVKNVILKLTNFLSIRNIEFYFTSPVLSNPGYNGDPYNEIIRNYFYCYLQMGFYDGFPKIGFDLINNMVKWSNRNSCYSIIKPNYDDALKEVESTSYDYYSNTKTYKYDERLREGFKSLYREIQLNNLLV